MSPENLDIRTNNFETKAETIGSILTTHYLF